MPRILILVFLSATFAAFGSSARAQTPIVSIQQGKLQGVASPFDASVTVYKDMPYAARPLGPNRWRPPQPATSWGGVRDATHFSHTCVQLPGEAYGLPVSDQDEDCLYVNVWTTAKPEVNAAPLPVMVWIHGGGFTGGAGSPGYFDGSQLALHGVVMVTFNYRLGVFGFLAHPELSAESPQHVSGNYGLLDQIAALNWVQHNIASFGGDPTRVTIFGESAGGTSIADLLISPLAKGLFSRAIIESPAFLFANELFLRRNQSSVNFTSMEDVGLAMNRHVDALRAMPARELQNFAMERMNQFFSPGGGGTRFFNPLGRASNPNGADMPWWPVVDGYVLPAPAKQAFESGCGSNVPLIVGWTSDEGISFFAQPLSTGEEYDKFLDNFAPEQGALKKNYAAETAMPNGNHRAGASIGGDAFFGYGSKAVATEMSKRNPAVFVYYFSRRNANDRKAGHGAPHSAFSLYGFGNLPNTSPWDATDKRIMHDAMLQWTTFAKMGDPNGPGLPQWPRYTPVKPDVLQIDDSSQSTVAPGLATDEIYSKVFEPFQHIDGSMRGCK
jgi:para-nitrobenzyl esterase